MQPATDFIDQTVYRHLADAIEEDVHFNDFKSLLQEKLQSDGRPLPVYVVVEERGPDHDKIFSVEVEFEGESIARGDGKTKKAAEQVAAERALGTLTPV